MRAFPKQWIFFTCAILWSRLTLGVDYEDLAKRTLPHLSELKRPIAIANQSGTTFCLYGGSSLNLLIFIKKKVKDLGGEDAYKKWLDSKPNILMNEWHRVGSDVDIMLLGREGTSPAKLSESKPLVEAALPGSIFYSKADINIAEEYFEKFKPRLGHQEPISTILISEKGFETRPELNVIRSGRTENLSRLGLEDFEEGKMRFALAEDFEKISNPLRRDTPANLVKLFRWIRRITEVEDAQATEPTKRAMKELLQILRTNEDEVVRLLRQGHLHRSLNIASDESKLIVALEKMQLYSSDPRQTQDLIKEFGIEDFAKKAGIKEARIYTPMEIMDVEARKKAISGKAPIGKERVLYHYTSLAGAQAMSQGALYQSDGKMMIGSTTSVANSGSGLYAGDGDQFKGYGDIRLAITLSKNAVAGVDFVEDSPGHFVIRNLNAIARDENDRLKVESPTLQTWIEGKLGVATSSTQGVRARRDAIVSLSKFLMPELISEHQKPFLQTLQTAKALGLGSDEMFLNNYFRRPGVLESILSSNAPFSDDLKIHLLNSDAVSDAYTVLFQMGTMDDNPAFLENFLDENDGDKKKRILNRLSTLEPREVPGLLREVEFAIEHYPNELLKELASIFDGRHENRVPGLSRLEPKFKARIQTGGTTTSCPLQELAS